jgi:hypothetical protein
MAVRTITGAKYNAHTEPLFKKLGILPLNNLIVLHRVEFMYSYMNRDLPTALLGSWPTVQERRQEENEEIIFPHRNLRNDRDLYLPRIVSTVVEKLPLLTLPKAWNELCTTLKQCETKAIFKTKNKYNFLDNLSDTITCNRLFCPSCALPVN